jgi:hypothetical protein
MASAGAKAAIVIAAVGAVAGVVLLIQKVAAAPPGGGQVAALQLNASVTTGNAPLTVIFSGVGLDPSGVAVPGVTIYFFVNNQFQSFAVPITTDANGAFAFQFTFSAAGTYICFVADNQAGT